MIQNKGLISKKIFSIFLFSLFCVKQLKRKLYDHILVHKAYNKTLTIDIKKQKLLVHSSLLPKLWGFHFSCNIGFNVYFDYNCSHHGNTVSFAVVFIGSPKILRFEILILPNPVEIFSSKEFGSLKQFRMMVLCSEEKRRRHFFLGWLTT